LRRLIKILIVSLVIIAALDLSVYFGAKYYLKKYNVTYSDFDFGFPARVNLKNLSYQNISGVRILISDLHLGISVKSLIKGQLVLRNLFIDRADISIINAGVKEKEAAEAGAGAGGKNGIDLPDFLAYEVSLNNSRFEMVNGQDSLELDLKGLLVKSLSSSEVLFADSLFINQLNTVYVSGNQHVKHSDNEAFTLNILPSFELAFADLNNCRFLYSDSLSHHSISSLDFRFSGLKSNELMNFNIDRLAFSYQDTIDMSIVLANGEVNSEFSTRLKDFRLNVPGMKLNIPLLEIDVSNGLKGSMSVDDSYLSFGLLRIIYPAITSVINPDVPADSLIFFRGGINAGRSIISLEPLSLDFFKETSLEINGTINISDPVPGLNLNINPLKTTGRDLEMVMKKAAYQSYYYWPEWLSGKIKISGHPGDIDIGGIINTSKGDLTVETNFQSGSNITHSYLVSVKADSLIVNDVARAVPLNIPYAYLNVNIEGNPGKDGNKKYFMIDLESSRLAFDTIEFNNIHLFYNSDIYSDSASASVSDELISLNLEAVKPGKSKEMTITGDIYRINLHDFLPGIPNTVFSSVLSGNFKNYDSEKEASVEFRNTVLTDIQDTVLLHDLKIGLWSGSDFMKINLYSGTGNFLEAKTGMKFPSFRMPLSEWLADWPETDVRASFNPNPELLRWLTGHDIRINLEELLLIKDDKKWVTELNIPHISYDSTSADGITLNFNSKTDEITGRLSIDKLRNPGIIVSPSNFDINYRDSVYYLRIESMLNEGKSRSVLSLEMADFFNGYRIRLNDADSLIINNSQLSIVDNTGIIINDSLHIIKGDIAVNDKSTFFEISTSGPEIVIDIDSLRLDNILSWVAKKEDLHGLLNLNGFFNTDSHDTELKGEMNSLGWGQTWLGDIDFHGKYSDNGLLADVNYKRDESEASVKIKKNSNNLFYSANLRQSEIDFINTLSLLPEGTELRGKLKGYISGERGDRNYADGILITDSIRLNIPELNTGVELDNDTIIFSENELLFRNFRVKDENTNDLIINGNIHFDPFTDFDMRVQSEKFRLLNNRKHTGAITGVLDVSADLKIKGNPDDLSVSGVFRTLPEASISYVLPDSYKLVDASQIVTFTDFTKGADSFTIADQKTDRKLNLNVDLHVSDTRIRIVLDEVSQQYLRLVGSGDFKLREGVDNKPLLFGSFRSVSGDAFISPPAIPDVLLVIDETKVVWNGMIDEPEITLRGFKEVKASPKGLSPLFSDNNGIETFKVFLILDQVTLTHFDLKFDLEGISSETNSYIVSLPEDTRQALAINLLVFGKFGTEENSKNVIADQVTSKLNEIARRNLKNSDLSFSTVSYKDGTTTGTEKERTDLSYSLSKRFINNRLTFSVGGSIGVYMEDITGTPPSGIIGNVELSYRIFEQPSISLKASRKDVYRGVIDGDVTEASGGIYYRKSYPRFRDFMHRSKNDSIK